MARDYSKKVLSVADLQGLLSFLCANILSRSPIERL